MKPFQCIFINLCITSFIICPAQTALGEDDPSIDSVALEKIVITANRSGQYGYRTTADVTVIGRKDIESSGAQAVSGILKEQLGVHVYDNSTYKTAAVDIRGFGDTAGRNVLILVNGRKINPIDISGPDLLQIPLESVEQIEIIRGSNSVLYGDNAVGGVINIITKEGHGDLSAQLGFDYGSYKTKGKYLELSGVHRKLSYYLHSKYFDTDGYRDNSEIIAKDFSTRIGYALCKKLKFDLMFARHEDDYGLPGGLNDTELKNLGRRGSADVNDFATTKDKHIHVKFDITPWDEHLDFGHFVIDVSRRKRDTFAFFASFGEFGTKRAIDTLGLNGKYILKKDLSGREFNVVTGIDYYDEENDILGTDFNTDDITISKTEFGAYTLAEYELMDNLFINGGTRYQKASYEFDQRSGIPNFERQKPEETVSLIGAKYEYAKGSNVFFDVQQTFRFLATDEWYDTFSGLNTALKQQTGIQYEFGLKHNFDGISLFTITPYRTDLKDEIFFDPAAGDSGFGANSNYDKTRRTGIEIGQRTDILRLIDTSFFEKLDFFTNYTYQSPKFQGGPNDDKLIPMAARHQASFGVNMGFPQGYQVSLTGRYVGPRFAINDTLNQTPAIKPYIVMDGKVSYQFKAVQIFAAVNNIFDQKYFTYVSKSVSSTTKDHFPSPERNFNFGMTAEF